jgi:hypothetical protein
VFTRQFYTIIYHFFYTAAAVGNAQTRPSVRPQDIARTDWDKKITHVLRLLAEQHFPKFGGSNFDVTMMHIRANG